MSKGDVSLVERPLLGLDQSESNHVFKSAYSELSVPLSKTRSENLGETIDFSSPFDVQNDPEVITRSDGQTISVTRDKDGKVTSLSFEDGYTYLRKPDGKWIEGNDSNSELPVTNISVNKDGSYTIERRNKLDANKAYSHESKSDGTVVAKWFERGKLTLEKTYTPE